MIHNAWTKSPECTITCDIPARMSVIDAAVTVIKAAVAAGIPPAHLVNAIWATYGDELNEE